MICKVRALRRVFYALTKSPAKQFLLFFGGSVGHTVHVFLSRFVIFRDPKKSERKEMKTDRNHAGQSELRSCLGDSGGQDSNRN